MFYAHTVGVEGEMKWNEFINALAFTLVVLFFFAYHVKKGIFIILIRTERGRESGREKEKDLSAHAYCKNLLTLLRV